MYSPGVLTGGAGGVELLEAPPPPPPQAGRVASSNTAVQTANRFFTGNCRSLFIEYHLSSCSAGNNLSMNKQVKYSADVVLNSCV
jgi:hypothetical protein